VAIGGELKADAADGGALQAEPQYVADFVQVRAAVDRAHERTTDVVPPQHFQGREFRFQQFLAAQNAVSTRVEPVELQVDQLGKANARVDVGMN
jgi:hypothetical protein